MSSKLKEGVKIHFIEWNSEYERMMTSSLKKDFPVFEIYRVKQHFKSLQRILPGRCLRQWHKKIHSAIKFRHIKENDIIICNGYSAFLLLDLLTSLHCKKILVLRDSVEALTSKRRRLKLLSDDENYLSRVNSVFDIIYSFDPVDCLKYGLSAVDQFLPFTHKEIRLQTEHQYSEKTHLSCFYVGGYDEYRASVIRQLTPLLQTNNCYSEFYLVTDKQETSDYPSLCINEKLTYKQNIEKIKHSNIILEMNKPGQTGLTLRALEAMAFNKKLITNNASIKNHNFYHPGRIFIWGEDHPDQMADFIACPVPDIDINLLKKYCADGMLKTLLGTALK
ncbi:hypothetical protein [Rahnella selenatireducens]|uniref:hypothetical protein n=1 Tax=Rahnella selenatireducens TaxID=3389797 RepID=UPI0039694884